MFGKEEDMFQIERDFQAIEGVNVPKMLFE